MSGLALIDQDVVATGAAGSSSTGDAAFEANQEGLLRAVELAMPGAASHGGREGVPRHLPERGIGEAATLEALAPWVIGGASRLDAPHSLAHMNPPTPWITWATTLWNAALNQNLLHRETGKAAREIERLVVEWIAPRFGMDGGHMTPGSTIANLTALWAARDLRRVRRVVASSAAHLSIRKAAHLLGLELQEIEPGADGALDPRALPADLHDACLVLTAGTTGLGAIDPLQARRGAAWTHVDAAWAGPLRFSAVHGPKLAGIEHADSISVSAHKLFFQPKEAALVLFRDTAQAHGALSFAADYLGTPNVGVQGSHGAVAVPLLATLLAWGREGLAQRIDRCMDLAEALADWIARRPELELYARPTTGIVVWRPRRGATAQEVVARLPEGMASLLEIRGAAWIRNVAANPCAQLDALVAALEAALR
jgi:L-2,4-diaminobutyrate decarboxylase